MNLDCGDGAIPFDTARSAHDLQREIYVRRDRAKGLLRTLVDALVPGLPGLATPSVSPAPAEALRRAWLATEGTGDVALWRVGWQEWLAEACERLRGHELFTTLAKPGAAAETVSGVQPQRAFDACARRIWNVK